MASSSFPVLLTDATHPPNMPQLKSDYFAEKEVGTATTNAAAQESIDDDEEARSLTISQGKSTSSAFFFRMDSMSQSDSTMPANKCMSNSSLSPSSMKEELMFSSQAPSEELFFTPLPEYWDDGLSTDTPNNFEPFRAIQTLNHSKPCRQSHRVHLKLRMRPYFPTQNTFHDQTFSTVEYEDVLPRQETSNVPHADSVSDGSYFDLSTPPLTPIRALCQVPLSIPELKRNESSIDYQSVFPRNCCDLPFLAF